MKIAPNNKQKNNDLTKLNRGFTLVELLAIIAVLAVIATVSIPIVGNIINDSKKKAYETSVQSVERAAEQYMLDNDIYVGNNGVVDVDLDTLLEEGYIQKIPNDMLETDYVAIQQVNNEFNYVFNGAGRDITDNNSGKTSKLVDLLRNNKQTSNAAGTYNIVSTKINGRTVEKLTGVKSNNYLMKNYVWYSGQLWQVLEINDDGIKMVTAHSLTAITYSSGPSDFDTSWVKDWLDNVFYANLKGKNIIVPTVTCVDTVAADSTTHLLSSGYTKMNSCSASGTKEYDVTLMTIEDYLYTGTNAAMLNNLTSFVDTDEVMWLVTPSGANNIWAPYSDNSKGSVLIDNYQATNTFGKGVRPVITISKDALVKDGTTFQVNSTNYAYGTKYNPYILTTNTKLASDTKIKSLTVGDYVYLDEGNNPNTAQTQSIASSGGGTVSYIANKNKVRYRVVKINEDGSVKVERADVLKNLPNGTVAYSSNYTMNYYYKIGATASDSCFRDTDGTYFDKVVNKDYTGGCTNHNYFKPNEGSGAYNYTESENIGYFLNNATNSFYNWYTAKTKDMIKLTSWNLNVSNYSRKYDASGFGNNTDANYYNHDNDGVVDAFVGLPSWGEMYTGNDLNYNYWYINRWYGTSGSASNVSTVNSFGYSYTIYAGYWYGVRPVVNLKSNVYITGGAGTQTEPYNIDID